MKNTKSKHDNVRIITFTDFVPRTGTPDSSIAITINSGVIDVPPNSLIPLPVHFIPAEAAGQAVTGRSIEILDPETYTEFQISVPNHIQPGKYYLEADLYAVSGGHQQDFRLKSATSFIVGDERPTFINQIVPNIINIDDYNERLNFILGGENLTVIDENLGLYVGSNNIRLLITELEETTIRARPYPSGEKPEQGSHLIYGYLKNGERTESTARLFIDNNICNQEDMMQNNNTNGYDYGMQPPIPPGDTIFEFNNTARIYSLNNASDSEEWYFTCDINAAAEKPMKLDEYDWCSQLTTIKDPVSGKDKAYIMTSSNILVFSYDKKIVIDKIKRTDGQKGFAVFAPKIYSDFSDPKQTKQRLFYTINGLLYDLNDASFKVKFPFSGNMVAITSMNGQKRSFFVFAFFVKSAKERADDATYMYAIEESAFFSTIAAKKEFTSKDFFSYSLGDAYIMDWFSGYVYCDPNDTGAQQLAVLKAQTSVAYFHTDETHSGWLQMFSLTDDGFKVIAEHHLDAEVFPDWFPPKPNPDSDKTDHDENFNKLCIPSGSNDVYDDTNYQCPFDSDFINHTYPGMLNHIINPDGSSSFHVIGIPLMVWSYSSFQQYSITIDQASVILYIINFDAAAKKLNVIDEFRIASYFKAYKEIPTILPRMCCVPNKKVTQSSSKQFVSEVESFTIHFLINVWLNKNDDGYGSPTDGSCMRSLKLTLSTINKSGKYAYDCSGKTSVLKYEEPSNFPILDDVTEDPKKKIVADLEQENKYHGGSYTLLSMFASVDFSGNSIIAGVPVLTQNDNALQLIGLYRALPFDRQTVKMMPSVSIATTKSVVNGMTKSVQTTWNAGYQTGGSYHGEVLSIGAHYGKNWGGSKMNMQSDQKSVSVHVSSNISEQDLIHAYGTKFYMWEYPVYRKSASSDPIDYLSVLIPEGFVDSILSSTDTRFAYKQDYEVGKILTYLDSYKPGYEPKDIWFQLESIVCDADTQGGTIVVYSKDNSTSKDKDKATDDGVNAGGSISLGYGGFDGGISGHYTKNTINNSATTTSRTNDLSISFHSGTVNDSGYEYQITPIVYSQEDNNMLCIVAEVKLTGPLWKKLYAAPDIIMMRVYPTTKDMTLVHFSRSIQFIDNKDGTVDINVHIFNNSFAPSLNIVCNVYEGMAIYTQGKDPITTNLKLLKKFELKSLEQLKRYEFTLKSQKLKPKTSITVEIEDISQIKKYYWGIYPYQAFDQKLLDELHIKI